MTGAGRVTGGRTHCRDVVAVGAHDWFLPPCRLVPAVRRTMGLDVRVFPGAGHLTTTDHLDEMCP
jgi:pimeloyl-ACP methyl ester carboxylesterase